MIFASLREVRRVGGFDQAVARLIMAIEDVFQFWTRNWALMGCGLKISMRKSKAFSLGPGERSMEVFIQPATWPADAYIACLISRSASERWRPTDVTIVAPHMGGFTDVLQLKYDDINPCRKLSSAGTNTPAMEEMWRRVLTDYLRYMARSASE